MDLYLAIDQGGHASRALVFDRSGAVVAEGFENIRVLHPQAHWVEHDPQEVLTATRRAIHLAVAQLGSRAQHIVAAGLATQRSSIVCWDRDTGAPLSQIISWQDRRAAEWIDRFAEKDEVIHRATGLFLTAHYGVSKLHWCMNNLPQVKAAHRNHRLAWGPMASFLLFHLLQERPVVVDPANASRTLLWNFHTRDWDDDLLDLFGLPREPLPRCVPTCHDFGHLEILGRSVPVTVVNGDQSAALYAFGVPQHGSAYVNIGTGAFVQRPSGGQVDYAPRLLTSVVAQCGDEVTHVLEGTVNGAGSALVEVERQLGIDPQQAERDIAQWLDASSNPPLFLNGVSGLGAPYWIPDFPSRFVGDGSAAERIVAVMESIVFLLQVNLEEMNHIFIPPRALVASGGLARLDGVCRRLADISGLPVHRPADCEATARGVAFLLAGQPAHWPEHGGGSDFLPCTDEALQQRFTRWREEMTRAVKPRNGS